VVGLDIITLTHVAIVIIGFTLVISILVRIARTGSVETSEEDIGKAISFVANQQLAPQVIIVTRYVRKLLLAWEYLILLISIASLALVAAQGLHTEGSIETQGISASRDFPEGVFIVYTSAGLNTSLIQNISPEYIAVYLETLGQPVVIKTQGRVLRVFNIMIIDCPINTTSYTNNQALRSLIARLCLLAPGVAYIYTPDLAMSSDGANATLYYGENELKAMVRIYEEDNLRNISSIQCFGEILSGFVSSMRYSGGLVMVKTSEFKEIFGLSTPNIAIVPSASQEALATLRGLASLGFDLICYRGYGSSDIIYIRSLPDRSENAILYTILASLAGGFFLIMFNRSMMPRITASSNAILISGGTLWISRIFPLVTLGLAELISIAVFILTYITYRILYPSERSLVLPVGVLLISIISFAISIFHMIVNRAGRGYAAPQYLERPIPVRSLSAVVEDIDPRRLGKIVIESLETSEFFSALDKEVLEQDDLVNIRLRILYRYSIGVGADVSIYITRHNKGVFLEAEVDAWSIEAKSGGLLDSVAKIVISRISGGVEVAKISGDYGKA